MKNITTVILAAGRSTRFISSKSKLTHELAGYPIISHVFDSAKKISENIVVVCNKDNYSELKNILILNNYPYYKLLQCFQKFS